MTQDVQVNEFKGFSLFKDIDDVELRARNRAVILTNLAEDYTNKEKKINAKGIGLIIGYFDQIPEDERAVVRDKFAETMLQRGYVLA